MLTIDRVIRVLSGYFSQCDNKHFRIVFFREYLQNIMFALILVRINKNITLEVLS